MTSGQGGRGPEQGWQPPQDQPGWQAPPGQGWQNPPPGWQDPQQGWQSPPPYGYAAAPSAPGHHLPPEAPPRPDTVRFGLGAFVAHLILGLVATVVAFGDSDALAQAQLAGSGVEFSEETLQALAVVGVVVGLLYAALRALVLLFAWKGHNWARIVLFVFGGLGILGGLLALGQPSTGFLSALSVFQTLLLVAGIVLLTRKPSSEWYRTMSARREAGLR